MKSKYLGIDERIIKCCCDSDDCIESGISFDGNLLRFHFLEYIDLKDGRKILNQKTRSMHLNKQTAKELINELKNIK